MPYASSWEFLAERFHCDESFLRNLNPKQTVPPAPGALVKVPNVIPFEIERCLETPLQPNADPSNTITAAVVDLSRLEIRKNELLIAVMPLSRARPDLRGRGKWTILQALPGPAFTTQRVPRNATIETAEDSAKDAAKSAQPAAPFTLPRGPRNPLGVIWIHLAKEGSTEPLPFGLHGTNIPSRMRSDESVGGFRLANWDIARAARMLPAGTPLAWLK
jgi:lipoprotein-anchoring transpeptidase ErfK/SrfK